MADRPAPDILTWTGTRTFMKRLLSILSLVLLFSLAGCQTAPTRGDVAIVQKVLDAILPPNFTGPIRVAHKNGYFRISIYAGGLRRGPAGWEWDWLVYIRDGVISQGTASFGTPPANVSFP